MSNAAQPAAVLTHPQLVLLRRIHSGQDQITPKQVRTMEVLERRGLVRWEGACPVVTPAGQAKL